MIGICAYGLGVITLLVATQSVLAGGTILPPKSMAVDLRGRCPGGRHSDFEISSRTK